MLSTSGEGWAHKAGLGQRFVAGAGASWITHTMWEGPGDFGATGELGGKQQRVEGGRPGAGRFCAAVGTAWDRAGREESHAKRPRNA